MSAGRKIPLWPWIVALLIGTLVLYGASFGPACWITSRLAGPHPIFNTLYAPLWRAARMFGGRSWKMLEDFGQLGMGSGSILMINLADELGDDWAVILAGPRD